MPENQSWVPQEDGTYQPSEALLTAIRETPERFPHAVEDIAALSGKTHDEVQAIIDNPYEKSVILGATVGSVVDVGQGLATGAGIAAEKLGAGAESLGMEGVGDYLKETGEGIKESAESWDPKFDTEKGLVESGLEGLGQAAPAIAGAVAAAPVSMGAVGALAAGSVAGAGIGYFTFENEDNLIQLADEVTGGAMPDFLVIDPSDDEASKHMKGMASMLLSELAMAGAFAGVGKIYKAWKGGGAEAAAKAAQEAAAEEGIQVTLGTAEEAATAGQLAVAKVAREVREAAPSPKEAEKLLEKEAAEANVASVVAKQTGSEVVRDTFNMGDFDLFRRESLGTLNKVFDKLTKRGDKASVEVVNSFKRNPEAVEAVQTVIREAYEAGRVGDFQSLRRLAEEASIPGLKPEWHANLVNDIMRSTLVRLDARYNQIVKELRAKPELRTNAAYREVLDDLFQEKRKVYNGMLSLGIKDRSMGTSLSLGLLSRRWNFEADEAFLKKVNEAADDLAKADASNPYSYDLRSTKAEVYDAMERRFADMGINPVDVVDQIDAMFDEFDTMRRGMLEGAKDNRMFGMTNAERQTFENSYWKAVQDLHASAMLGQLSTTGLEIISNAAQNALLPLRHIFGRKLTDLGYASGAKRAVREYAGYMTSYRYAVSNLGRSLKTGKDAFNEADILEGSHSGLLDYKGMSIPKQIALRLWKSAADLSVAASSSMKTMRAFGVAYADGYEAAIKSGASKPEAKKAAKEYAKAAFDENGKIIDRAIDLQVQRSSWQQQMDTRYVTGKLAQFVENRRNSSNGLEATAARAVVPFFRTLVNIGSDAMQTSMPIPGELLRAMDSAVGKVSGKHPLRAAKFLDDFSGRNGIEAQMSAQARQRVGFAILGSAMALQEAGQIEITPPGGFQSWDAKQAQWVTRPGTSLIIGDTAIDLTRGLPFTAPLILAGILRDQVRDQKLEMENGVYAPDPDAFGMLGIGMVSYGTLFLSLMSDLGAMRGVTDTFDAFTTAFEKGDLSQLGRVLTNYGKGFTPGIVRMYGKNRALLTGDETDWDQFKGEHFIDELMSSAGFQAGYKRLDFLGKPLRDPARGLDPFNMKPVKINDDEVYQEYSILSQDADFGIAPDNPDKVFDKTFWKRLGVDTSRSFLEGLVEAPKNSLTQVKLKNGMNAYEAYRRMIYEGRLREDVQKSTGRYGDRINIGAVVVLKGENFEDAIRRTVATPGYNRLTPEGRQKVWQTIFGIYKKEAKDFVANNAVAQPDIFQKSQYGTPIQEPTTISKAEKAGKDLAKQIQTTQGMPVDLDELFSLD